MIHATNFLPYRINLEVNLLKSDSQEKTLLKK